MSGDGSVSDRPTPIGVTAVCLLVAVYGLGWLVSSFTAIYGQPTPNFFALMGPVIGLVLLLIAIGLWDLQWPAWVLSVTLFGAITFWDVIQSTPSSLDSLPFIPALIVLYLLVRQELYFRHTGP